jgi:hypothetical protein
VRRFHPPEGNRQRLPAMKTLENRPSGLIYRSGFKYLGAPLSDGKGNHCTPKKTESCGRRRTGERRRRPSSSRKEIRGFIPGQEAICQPVDGKKGSRRGNDENSIEKRMYRSGFLYGGGYPLRGGSEGFDVASGRQVGSLGEEARTEKRTARKEKTDPGDDRP